MVATAMVLCEVFMERSIPCSSCSPFPEATSIRTLSANHAGGPVHVPSSTGRYVDQAGCHAQASLHAKRSLRARDPKSSQGPEESTAGVSTAKICFLTFTLQEMLALKSKGHEAPTMDLVGLGR